MKSTIALIALMLSTASVWAQGTFDTTITLDGAIPTVAPGTVEPQGISNGVATLKVTANTGYYIEASDITVIKTIDGQYAQARRRAEGNNISEPITLTPSGTVNPTGETLYTFTVTDQNYDYEVTADFHALQDISTATVTLSQTSFTYDGTAKKPGVTSVVLGTTTIASDSYSVSYENNVNAADASADMPPTVNVTTTKIPYTGVAKATFTIEKAKVTLSFSSPSASAKINEAFTLPTLTISPSDLTVSYTSSDEKVAKIDASSGKVTLVSAGKTTITATYKESENYQSVSASYLLTVEEADSPVLDPMEKGEENTMDPNDFLYPNGTDKNLNNVVIDRILFTLKNTDSEKGDGFDSSDNSIVVNTVTELSVLMDLLQKGVEPGSPEFAESFTGMTFLLPPGEGYLIIESQESNGCRLMVKIGTDEPLPIYQTERGTYSIPYSKEEATYVFMWNGGPDVKSSSRSQAISKGKKVMGDVKVFRVSNKQNASSSGVLMGDANGDGSMDVKDITAVRRFIMGFTVEGFNKTSADVNYDGQINVVDIVKLTGLISSGL